MTVNFTAAGDPTTNGFVVYCDPVPGQEDPSTRVDAGDVNEEAGVPVCTEFPFGYQPRRRLLPHRGRHDRSQRDAFDHRGVERVRDVVEPGRFVDRDPGCERVGYAYHVAMAATDYLDNPSQPSDWTFSRPITLEDFWQLFKGAGGLNAGGVCSLQAVGMPVGLGSFGLVTLAAAIAASRRRRKK